MPVIKHIKSKNSYIRKITGDPVYISEVRNILKEFNNLTHIDIVPSKGSRPIDIEIIQDFPWNIYNPETTLGRANIKWESCKIKIALTRHDNLQDFKNTIIHEYLHCMGYNHVDKRGDLMYKYAIDVDSNSINNYANRLARTLK